MRSRGIRVWGAVLSAVLFAAGAYAEGGGGWLHGLQTSEYPFPNNSLGLMYTGAYGYQVSGHEIKGGFGVGLSDFDGQTGIAGGYGGVIYGARGKLGPVNLMITSWTGIGGIRFSEALGGDTLSYVIATEELDLELGLAVLPWFMPVVYAGYQVMGNLGPGKPFQDFFSYTPVVGVRFTFGKLW